MKAMSWVQASSPEEYEEFRRQAREAGVRVQPLGSYRLAVPGNWQPAVESTPEELEVTPEVTETPTGVGTTEESIPELPEPAQAPSESDPEPTSEPAPETVVDDVFDPNSHTAKQVLAHVDEHPGQLASVLEAEKAGQGRVTLVRELETRLEGNGGN